MTRTESAAVSALEAIAAAMAAMRACGLEDSPAYQRVCVSALELQAIVARERRATGGER